MKKLLLTFGVFTLLFIFSLSINYGHAQSVTAQTLSQQQHDKLDDVIIFIQKNYTIEQQETMLPKLMVMMEDYETQFIGVKKILAIVLKQKLFEQFTHIIEIDPTVLAECMDSKGIKLYSTTRCSHCLNQKAMFGPGMQYINNTDCDADRQSCIYAGVKGFPTWQDEHGNLYPGTQSLHQLAQISGCQQ